MKKIIFFVLCFISYSSMSFAQNKKANALKDKIAQEVCDCISQSDVDLDNEEDVKLKLGLCLMQSISENQKQAKKLGIEIEDKESLTRFSEDVGLSMASKCPTIFMGFAKKELKKNEKSNLTQEVEVQTLEGTITNVEEGAFVTITIKDNEGRSHNVLWLEFFENADELKENYSNLKDKEIDVEYYEKEYYNPKIEDYVKVKVLRKVEFK